MKGIIFGDKHSFNDLDLILNSKEIPLPDPKTYILDVPGADGQLDLSTALTDGYMTYKNRELQFNFTINKPFEEWEKTKSKIAAYLHGKTMKVQVEADEGYYYYGRCWISQQATKNPKATLTISVDADPYKYDVLDSTERTEWEWFDGTTVEWNARFHFGGRTNKVVPPQKMRVVPTFIVSEDMTLEYKTSKFALYEGENIIPSVMLTENEEDNTMTFIGNNNNSKDVTISFRGGVL